MPATRPTFLTATWRRLLFLNYPVDAAVLQPRVPEGCTLDLWNGSPYMSLVGFRFLDTRLLGVPIPFHRHFDEVNLRFYVVREEPNGTRKRGVAFVKELVPRWAIATVARTLYGEKYEAVPMRHRFEPTDYGERLRFEWRRGSRWESLAAEATGSVALAGDGTEEAFITEHYWGYASRRGGGTTEYEVVHPKWTMRPAFDAEFAADVATLYGPEFVAPLSERPTSTFVADGSDVSIRWGRRLSDEGPQ